MTILLPQNVTSEVQCPLHAYSRLSRRWNHPEIEGFLCLPQRGDAHVAAFTQAYFVVVAAVANAYFHWRPLPGVMTNGDATQPIETRFPHFSDGISGRWKELRDHYAEIAGLLHLNEWVSGTAFCDGNSGTCTVFRMAGCIPRQTHAVIRRSIESPRYNDHHSAGWLDSPG